MTNLIFDFDGTLHNTIKIYAPAFRRAYQYLVEQKLAPSHQWTEAEIRQWIGYSSKDMWNKFMPELSEQQKEKCSRIIGCEMLTAFDAGQAQLYEGVPQMLTDLKDQGYRLIFLSNCKIAYMEACQKTFSLARYFTDFYCTEQYDFAPKVEIYKDIADKYGDKNIIIGDRYADMEVAIKNQLPAIGCRYGYGNDHELKSATIIIDAPKQIVIAIKQINIT